MPALDCKNECDVCGKPRAFGDNTYKHTKCSKIRQARYALIREKEAMAKLNIKRAGKPAGEGV